MGLWSRNRHQNKLPQETEDVFEPLVPTQPQTQEETMETATQPQTQEDVMPESMTTTSIPAGNAQMEAIDNALDVAERFVQQAQTLKNHMAAEAFDPKSPALRRCKRSSLDLSSELVLMRKELP